MKDSLLQAFNILLDHGWSLYLIFALVFCGIGAETYKFWIILIPTVIFGWISRGKYHAEND
jgi:hypothetical protein